MQTRNVLYDPSTSWIWLLLAGFGAGLAGSVAGLASLVSYPALLGVGLAPVAANVTNTVSLVFSAAGSVWGFLPELSGQRGAVRRLAPFALAGGLSGALLLLLTPPGYFTLAVPVLLAGASLAVLAPRPALPAGPASRRRRRFLAGAVYLVALYGGYFGAGAGVVLLAVLLASTASPLARCAALRNLLLGLANAVAAVSFGLFGPVHWLAALPLACGFLAGGRLGPAVVRRAPQRALRALVALGGLGVAVRLAVAAY